MGGFKVGDAILFAEGHRLGGPELRRLTAKYVVVLVGTCRPVVQSAESRASLDLSISSSGTVTVALAVAVTARRAASALPVPVLSL